MNTLNVVVVGCGIIGYHHAKAMNAHPALRLVAVVDAVPAAAAALAGFVESDLGAGRPREFASLADALGAENIDLVVICTPSGLHVSVAEEALAANCHVVIEKPLDVSLARAGRIAALARAAEQRGLVVSVISQHRFDPASVVVAEAIAAGRFGRVTSAVASVAWWRSQEYYDSGNWRGTWELDGGGAVMNQGVHTVDLLVWFLGTPVEISAQTARLAHDRIEVEDTAVATIRFDSGALAVVHATTAAYPDMTVRLQVHGSRGSAIIDDDQLEFFHSADLETGAADNRRNQVAEVIAADQIRGASKAADQLTIGHLRQYENVVAAIASGGRPGVSVDDALLSLAVVETIYLSATLGRPILVADVLDGQYVETALVTGGIR